MQSVVTSPWILPAEPVTGAITLPLANGIQLRYPHTSRGKREKSAATGSSSYPDGDEALPPHRAASTATVASAVSHASSARSPRQGTHSHGHATASAGASAAPDETGAASGGGSGAVAGRKRLRAARTHPVTYLEPEESEFYSDNSTSTSGSEIDSATSDESKNDDDSSVELVSSYAPVQQQKRPIGRPRQTTTAVVNTTPKPKPVPRTHAGAHGNRSSSSAGAHASDREAKRLRTGSSPDAALAPALVHAITSIQHHKSQPSNHHGGPNPTSTESSTAVVSTASHQHVPAAVNGDSVRHEAQIPGRQTQTGGWSASTAPPVPPLVPMPQAVNSSAVAHGLDDGASRSHTTPLATSHPTALSTARAGGVLPSGTAMGEDARRSLHAAAQSMFLPLNPVLQRHGGVGVGASAGAGVVGDGRDVSLFATPAGGATTSGARTASGTSSRASTTTATAGGVGGSSGSSTAGAGTATGTATGTSAAAIGSGTSASSSPGTDSPFNTLVLTPALALFFQTRVMALESALAEEWRLRDQHVEALEVARQQLVASEVALAAERHLRELERQQHIDMLERTRAAVIQLVAERAVEAEKTRKQ